MKLYKTIIIKIKYFIDLFITLIGLIIFKIKHPNTKWVRPVKIGTFYSQAGQDFFLASLLFGAITRNNKEKLWIVDVGCNHPINYNNSYFFEKYFGCSTLAIDPIFEFSEIWSNKRPDAIFCTTAVGDRKGFIKLNLPNSSKGDNMFSFVENGVGRYEKNNFTEREVELNTLEDLFSKNKIDKILFLSIDVEGFELNTIKGINFENVLIYCLLIENNSNSLYGSDEIRNYLLEKNYTFYARIGHLDDVFIHNSMIRGL
jgi:FkbM family methyltransferase